MLDLHLKSILKFILILKELMLKPSTKFSHLKLKEQ